MALLHIHLYKDGETRETLFNGFVQLAKLERLMSEDCGSKYLGILGKLEIGKIFASSIRNHYFEPVCL